MFILKCFLEVYLIKQALFRAKQPSSTSCWLSKLVMLFKYTWRCEEESLHPNETSVGFCPICVGERRLSLWIPPGVSWEFRAELGWHSCCAALDVPAFVCSQHNCHCQKVPEGLSHSNCSSLGCILQFNTFFWIKCLIVQWKENCVAEEAEKQ